MSGHAPRTPDSDSPAVDVFHIEVQVLGGSVTREEFLADVRHAAEHAWDKRQLAEQ